MTHRPLFHRGIAIFRETRNGVYPILGAKNWAMVFSLRPPRSSCVRPDAHYALRQDSRNNSTPCRITLHFASDRDTAPGLRRNARPYGYAGVVALRSSLALPRFPVLLRQGLRHNGPPLPDGRATSTRPGHHRFLFYPTHTTRKRAKFHRAEALPIAQLNVYSLSLSCLHSLERGVHQ